MKILQINCVYPQGSTGQQVQLLHSHLRSQGMDALVLYGRGKRSRTPEARKLCPEWYGKANRIFSRFTGLPYGGCLLSTGRLLGILRREKPDIVHLHCINGHFVNLYRLITWLKEHRIKTVLTLHAEFFYTGGCGLALDCGRWRHGCGNCPRLAAETGSLFRDATAEGFCRLAEAFRGFEQDLTVVSVSPWLRRRAEASPILHAMRHETIGNGLDTHCFSYGEAQTERRVIFHATPLFSDDPAHIKGGWYVLELAKRLSDLPVTFRVAGPAKLNAPLPPNVTLLGSLPAREAMAEQYRQATLTLLTSRAETFSLVCGESLCCGTPVIGFSCGGPESVCPELGREFVPYGDLDALEEAVRRWLEVRPDRQRIARSAAGCYDARIMLDAYTRLYREVARHDPR